MARVSRLLETGRFAGLQFLFWSSIVCFEAFMVPFITGAGYSPSQAGFVMSAIFGFAIVGQPLLGSISDRLSSPRWIAAPAMLIAGAGALLLPSASRYFVLIVAIALLYSLTANSIPAVLDAWIMARRRGGSGASYGVARGFGSLGFAVGAVVVGSLADRFGIASVFRAYGVIAVATALAALTAPGRFRLTGSTPREPNAAETAAPTPEPTSPSGADDRADGRDDGLVAGLRAAATNREYVLLLAASFLAFVGFRAGITFLPLALTSVGGSISDVGVAHSIAALSEVPVLFLSGLVIRRLRGEKLIATVLFLMAARMASYSLATGPAAVLAIQASHGITFGLFLAAVVHYIDVIAPAEHRGLFQAIAPSVFFGLGSVVGSWTGGLVIEALSITWLFRLSALAALAGAAILPVFGRGRPGARYSQ